MKHFLVEFAFIVIVLALAVVAFGVSREAQQKRTQAEILDAVPFDRVVLTTLIALERNYKVKKYFLPGVHEDDYYAVILNTAKRITLAENRILTQAIENQKISTVIPAKQDSTDAKK